MQQLVAEIKALDSGIKAIETEINDFGEKVRNMREMLAAKEKALRDENAGSLASLEQEAAREKANCQRQLSDIESAKKTAKSQFADRVLDARKKAAADKSNQAVIRRNGENTVSTWLSLFKPKQIDSRRALADASLSVPESEIREAVGRYHEEGFLALVKRLFHIKGYAFKWQMRTRIIDMCLCRMKQLEQNETRESATIDSDLARIEADLASRRDAELQGLDSQAQGVRAALANALAAIDGRRVAANDKLKADLAALASQEAAFKSQCDDKKKRINDRIAAFMADPLYTEFNARMNGLIVGLGIIAKEWESYNPVGSSDRMAIGMVHLPSGVKNPRFVDGLKRDIKIYADGRYRTPFVVPARSSFRSFIRYEGGAEEGVSAFIQQFILQKIRCNPCSTVRIYFCDPEGRGSNLGRLNSPENERIGCVSSHSPDGVRATLDELVKYIDDLGSTLKGAASIYEYNKNAAIKYGETVLVMCDVDRVLDNRVVDSLRTIWQKAEACGISVIVSSRSTPAELSELARSDAAFLSVGNPISCAASGCSIQIKGSVCPFTMPKISTPHVDFLADFREKYEEYCKVDNSFARFYDPRKQYDYLDATKAIRIPLMVKNVPGGGLCDFVIDSQNATHSLITGTTGSGKSTFLHALIASIVMHYHPDDVALWLVDYGMVEFKRYLDKCPRHIRFLSLDNSEDFTRSFVEYVREYFENRKRLFAKASVSSIAEFRAIYGQLSMPRVVIIMDEAHCLAQVAKSDISFRNALENILTEYRKYGLSIVFSNQTMAGMNGLSDTTFDMISGRIALKGTIAEMKLTLGALGDNFTDAMLKRMERSPGYGDLWFKEPRGGGDFVIDNFRSLYAKSDEIDAVLDTSLARGDEVNIEPKPLIIDGSSRHIVSDDELAKIVLRTSGEDGLTLPLGDPSSIGEYYSITLLPKPCNNIMLYSDTTEKNFDIIATILRAVRFTKYSVVVLSEVGDHYLTLLKRYMADFHLGDRLRLIEGDRAVCGFVSETLAGWKKGEGLKDTVLVWLGLEDLYDTFAGSPERAPQAPVKTTTMFDFSDFGLEPSAKPALEEAPVFDDGLYDARVDIMSLIREGSRHRVFSVMAIEAVLASSQRFFDPGVCKQKIAFGGAKQTMSSLEFNMSCFSSQSEMKAVVWDGRRESGFRPYKFIQK